MTFSNGNIVRDINQCRQMIDQLMQECRSSDTIFRQVLQQESQNVEILQQEARKQSQMLDEMAQREQQTVQRVEIAMRDNEMAYQRLQQASQLCVEMEQAVGNVLSNLSSQSASYQTNQQQFQ